MAFALTLAIPSLARAERYDGNVLLPLVTPAVAHALHDANLGPNGLTGYVMRLNRVVPEGTDYRLRKTDGSTLVDLDVYFYRDAQAQSICPFPRDTEPDGNGGESGDLTCDARWAVVVLFTGFDAEFRLDV